MIIVISNYSYDKLKLNIAHMQNLVFSTSQICIRGQNSRIFALKTYSAAL